MRDDGIGGKYESMLKSYGKIENFSAIDNINRNQEDELEEYSSQYSKEERTRLQSEEARKLEEMQERLAQSTRERQELSATGLTEEARLARNSQREQETKYSVNIPMRYYYQRKVLQELGQCGQSFPWHMGSSVRQALVKPFPSSSRSSDSTVPRGLRWWFMIISSQH